MSTSSIVYFINYIIYSEKEDSWKFYGDGQGDSEDTSSAVYSEEILEKYITECENQIALAKIYIKEKL